MWNRLLPAVFVVAAGMFAGSTTRAGHLDQHLIVQGIEIYYGLVPAESIRDIADEERKMHGGIPGGPGQHHLTVALFDAKTQQRITDAEVRAKVGELGLAPQERKLDLMIHGGAPTYCHYFNLAGSGPYRITVLIRKAGAARPVEANFDYSHPRR